MESRLTTIACVAALFAHAAVATPPTVDVNVINEPAVTVKNFPATEPIAIAGTCYIPQGEVSCSIHSLYTVPAGKRLTIEYVSLLAIDSTPAEAIEMQVSTSQVLSHRPTFHLVPVGSVGTANVPRQARNEVVRLYFEADELIDIFVLRTPQQANAISVRAFMSGYLVDM